MNDRYLARRVRDSDANDLGKIIEKGENRKVMIEKCVILDIHQINVVENSSVRLDEDFDGMMRLAEDSRDSWYKDYDDPSELGIPMDLNLNDPDDPETDVEDYEELYSAKKKKKKGKTPVRLVKIGPILFLVKNFYIAYLEYQRERKKRENRIYRCRKTL